MPKKVVALVTFGLLVLSGAARLDAAPETPRCAPADGAFTSSPSPLLATSCVGGFAGSFPCQNVDLMALVSLSTMECGSGNSLWGWTDPLDVKEYALMGCGNGISFVNITIPDSPVYLGRLPTHSGNSLWRDVRVYANYAFIVSEANNHGMQIFDLTQLRNVPSPPVTFSETAHYGGFDSSHTIAIDEATGFAYAAGSDTCAGGLHMVNIQDPLNPVSAGCVSQDGYTHETQCVVYDGPDSTYAGHEICFSSNEDTLTIVDVTDKSNPVQLSRTGYAGSGYVHQGWLTEDQTYFLHDDELDEIYDGHNTYTYMWNVSDRDAPILMGHYTAPTPAIDHNLYVHGGYAYETNYRAGLRILDATGIAAASLVSAGYFDTYPDDNAPEFNSAWNNYPFFASGNVIVSDIEQGLFVLHPNINPYPTSLFVSDTSVTEGDSGTVVASFTVSLSNPVPQTVTVNYATGFGDATPGVDYDSASGTLTFDPGTTAQTIDVTVHGDTLSEANETFVLFLTNPVNARIADNSGTGTILDDDPLPLLSIGDAAVTEGDSGMATASFAVTLSAPSGQRVSVSYATSDGTANAGSDYVAESGLVTFAAGSTSRTITVSVLGDLADEPDETFFVNLSDPIHATLDDVQAAGTIVDDDVLTVAAISPASGPASGGTSVTITGKAFVGGATVTIGGVPATDVLVSSPGELTAVTPALTPGLFDEVAVTVGAATAALSSAFFADFLDVPGSHPFHDFVVTVARHGITAGCGGGNYCPDASVTRAQMAVFLLRAEHGSSYAPPVCSGLFTDVPCPGGFAADWIEQLSIEGITAGCGGGNYCPGEPVTRAQMAVFLLKAEHGSSYAPPACAGTFQDVACTPTPAFAVDWIEQLYTEGVTGGCNSSPLLYCPDNPNTRGQMAVFLTKTFGLQ